MRHLEIGVFLVGITSDVRAPTYHRRMKIAQMHFQNGVDPSTSRRSTIVPAAAAMRAGCKRMRSRDIGAHCARQRAPRGRGSGLREALRERVGETFDSRRGRQLDVGLRLEPFEALAEPQVLWT
jgi:hypothetical protein